MAATWRWGAAISACMRSLRHAALTPTTCIEAVAESSSTSARPEAEGCAKNWAELCMNLNWPRMAGKSELPRHHNSHRRFCGKHERGRDQATPATKTCRRGPRQGPRERRTKRTRDQGNEG